MWEYSNGCGRLVSSPQRGSATVATCLIVGPPLPGRFKLRAKLWPATLFDPPMRCLIRSRIKRSYQPERSGRPTAPQIPVSIRSPAGVNRVLCDKSCLSRLQFIQFNSSNAISQGRGEVAKPSGFNRAGRGPHVIEIDQPEKSRINDIDAPHLADARQHPRQRNANAHAGKRHQRLRGLRHHSFGRRVYFSIRCRLWGEHDRQTGLTSRACPNSQRNRTREATTSQPRDWRRAATTLARPASPNTTDRPPPPWRTRSGSASAR